MVDGPTEVSLTAHTEPIDGGGWPPPETQSGEATTFR